MTCPQLDLVYPVISRDQAQQGLLKEWFELEIWLNAMDSLDRVFDAYERLMPRHFGEVMVAVVFFSLVIWVAL